MGRKTKYKCLKCNKEYSSYRDGSKYCSRACFYLLSSKLTAKERGNKQRGRGSKDTYTKRDGKHEHRLVMENCLGRPLMRHEVVHHKDGNKKNNDISNLELMQLSEHTRIHSTKNRLCEVSGCGKKHRSIGMCESHYRKYRYLKNGVL